MERAQYLFGIFLYTHCLLLFVFNAYKFDPAQYIQAVLTL